jgi:hypothetical protein
VEEGVGALRGGSRQVEGLWAALLEALTHVEWSDPELRVDLTHVEARRTARIAPSTRVSDPIFARKCRIYREISAPPEMRHGPPER